MTDLAPPLTRINHETKDDEAANAAATLCMMLDNSDMDHDMLWGALLDDAAKDVDAIEVTGGEKTETVAFLESMLWCIRAVRRVAPKFVEEEAVG